MSKNTDIYEVVKICEMAVIEKALPEIKDISKKYHISYSVSPRCLNIPSTVHLYFDMDFLEDK